MITGRFEGVFSKPVSASYLISEPSGEGPHPLLLFLHGFGERGDDLEAVKRHGPPKEAAAGRYTLERSSDLKKWTPTTTNLTASGTLDFLLPLALDFRSGSFRARQ